MSEQPQVARAEERRLHRLHQRWKNWGNTPLKKQCACGHWAASHVRADPGDRHCSECDCKAFGAPLTQRQLRIKNQLTFWGAVALVFSISQYIANLIHHSEFRTFAYAISLFIAVVLIGIGKVMVGR